VTLKYKVLFIKEDYIIQQVKGKYFMNPLSNERKTIDSRNILRAALIPALAASILILIPLIASRITDEVNWSVSDFITAWILLFSAGFTYKLVTINMRNMGYRIAAGITVATALFLVWSNLAVGLIGSENNPANLMYLGVLAALLIGSIIARFKSYGMVLALAATVLAQILVTVVAVIAGLGTPENTPLQLVFINGFFIALWVSSALLFWYSAKRSSYNGR
jgi:hypothetical protein